MTREETHQIKRINLKVEEMNKEYICQCIAVHFKFPGKMSLYTVATYSQHSVASNIFASRAVFAVLRPISVALSRHQFWAVCDPIIGPVAGALQSQRDALAHRA